MPTAPRRVLAEVHTVLLISFRQLWERKLLNGIAVLGVTLGVLTLIAMNGIMQGFQTKFTAAILKVSPHVTMFDTELRPMPSLLERTLGGAVAARIAHDSPTDRQSRIKRPQELVRALEAMPGVRGAAASLAAMVLVEYGGKTRSIDLRGIHVSEQIRVTDLRPYVKQGDFAALGIASDGLAVGSGVASDLGLHVGDVVRAATPTGTPLELKVVSIFEVEIPPVDKARAYASLRNVQTLLGRPDVVGRIEVSLDDPDQAMKTNELIERMSGYDCESWQETNSNFLSLFAMQNMIIRFVIGAILLVGGFGILAVQIMIVLQKQRDIAIMRSIGLRRADILRVFLLQGLVVALVGGLLGAGLGRLAVIWLSQLRVHMEGLVKSDTFLVQDDPAIYGWGLLFALLTGVIASLIPAIRGSRVEPVDVLRGQIG